MAVIDEVLFPDLITAGSSGGATYSTSVIQAPSGIAQRNANRFDGIGKWRINCENLNPTQLAAYVAFFRAGFGRGRCFRFRAPEDYTATLEVFATGNGTTGPYQLSKTYTRAGSSDVRKIIKPVAGGLTYDSRPNSVTIYKDGSLVAATVSSTTGAVTLGAAAAGGTILSWSGQFDVPAWFASDEPNFTFDTGGISSWSIEIWEALPVEFGL